MSRKTQTDAIKQLFSEDPCIGRRKLMKLTGCTDWAAKRLIKQFRNPAYQPPADTPEALAKRFNLSDRVRSGGSPELESLRAANRRLSSELIVAAAALGDIGEAMSAVRDEIVALQPVRLDFNPGRAPGKGQGRPVTLVVQLTDWHIGQTTPEDLVEGFNAFNWDIAQRRVEKFAGQLFKYTQVLRSGYTVSDCVILCTGDYISGDIHDGLVRTNEFQAPKQAVLAGRLVSAFAQTMASFFPRVRVEFIAPGNHDRLTRKPQVQAGGENSWGFVVGSIAEDLLAEQKNVRFNLYTSMQEIIDVAGRRYLCGHGDGILGTWGIPFYGIDRKVSRESKARMNMPEERRFHKIVIGHFHTGLDHPDWFVGGSLSGTDEFDHKCGRHCPAHQTSWVVHPEHGEFDWTRWWL